MNMKLATDSQLHAPAAKSRSGCHIQNFPTACKSASGNITSWLPL